MSKSFLRQNTSTTTLKVENSLVRLLLHRLEKQWHSGSGRETIRNSVPDVLDEELLSAKYRAKRYLRRRAPDEIEAVLTQLDQQALDMIKHSFCAETSLDLTTFVEAVVKTGTYDADRVLAFIGGMVDLFLEMLRSQTERADFGSRASLAVNWAQLMNHFIESPEIAMFEASEVTGGGIGAKALASNDKLPQVHKSSFVDGSKHVGTHVEKIYWIPTLDMLATVECTQSMYFWSPTVAMDAPRSVTPQLPPVFCDDHPGRALFSVIALAWDNEAQDLVALLSNRILVMWRLRNREKTQFQQKRELRFNATKTEARLNATGGERETYFKVYLTAMDPKTGEDVYRDESKPTKAQTENAARKEKRDERHAAEASSQLDIWWNGNLKMWVTTDIHGRLSFWDLRQGEGLPEPVVWPSKVLTAHTKAVTSHLELSKFHFTTCSLDRSVMLWDDRSTSTAPEVKVEELKGAVLSQAYLPLFSSLVTVGCFNRVYVWSIDSTAYRGMRAKLSGHQANLLQVSAGQRVFITLDETYTSILWDGATLGALQTCSCKAYVPRHIVVLPTLGRICLAGRRLNFLDGNEQGSIALGAAPTKEQLAKAKRLEMEGNSLKDSAAPKWCGLAPSRGSMLSATEAEVRLHTRGSPDQSRAIFNAPEGDSISAFAACDATSFAVLGTSKGAIYFLKYRSGFALKVYHGRLEGHDDLPAATSATAGEKASGDVTSDASAVATMTGAEVAVPSSGQSNSRHGSKGNPGQAVPDAVPEVAPEGKSEKQESRAAPKSTSLAPNSPSAEDIQRGLSSSITVVVAVEEQRRVYVGTAEGRVIIFTADADFPVLRWFMNPDQSPVTCITVAPWAEGVEAPKGEEPGLLVVGTQEGIAHIYSLANLRFAGSLNVPKALPEVADATSHWSSLRHIRLFPVAAESNLPLTLLTIDSQSRLRLWGLRVNAQSGRLVALKLVLDAGNLRESDCLPASYQGRPEVQPKAKASDSSNSTSPSGYVNLEDNAAATQRVDSKAAVRFTALNGLHGEVLSASEALKKQPKKGPEVTAAQLVAEMLQRPAVMAKLSGATTGGAPDSSVFMTQPSFILGAGAEKAFLEKDEDISPEDMSGSDSDGDVDAAVLKRLLQKPKSPRSMLRRFLSKAVNEEHQPEMMDGNTLVILGDSGGWIWCIDIASTVAAAVEKHAPVAVALDAAAVAEAAKHHASKRTKRGDRTSIRPEALAGSLGATGGTLALGMTGNSGLFASSEKDIGTLVGLPPKVRPEVVHVIGSWPAHGDAIASLVISGTPAALVSIDKAKEVKVWSTSADLWGHFSLRSGEQRLPATAVWPPPHVLAAQISLMRTAKGLCRRMGFQVTLSEQNAARNTMMKAKSQAQLRKVSKGASLTAEVPGTASSATIKKQASFLEPEGSDGHSDSVKIGPSRERFETEQTECSSAESAADGIEDDMTAVLSAAIHQGPSVVPEESDDDRNRTQFGVASTEEEEGFPQSFERTPSNTKKGRKFTQLQMREMIRNHAFSGGCQSYKQFKLRPDTAVSHGPQRGESIGRVDAQRESFFGRDPSAFGVELHTSAEKEAWETGVRSLGQRSASEGALLRYATNSVEEMTRQVRNNLGVDVTKTSRKMMRKPSFLSSLDVSRVSDPSHTSSATAQAVRKLMGSESTPKVATLPLLNAGQAVVGKSGSSKR